ncbi:hypothetical protein BGZ46_009338 [Entomortierella lignicola]|nr:hypothetical protein BGZ46_009338 [Entomortierella lignicola]
MAPTRVDPEVDGDTMKTTTTTTTTTCTDATEENTSEPTATTTTSDSAAHPHHVLFVVHGMGRQLEEHGNYERNVSQLVENTKTVLQSTFHELQTDVHIIPTEWHAKLHSLVDDRMALASLRTVPKDFNNHFGSVIIRMIVEDLNEAYETFMSKHPDFNGKISIFALSLGGVAMFDILTCIDDDAEEDESTSTNASDNVQVDPIAKAEEVGEDKMPEKNTSTKKTKIRKQDQPKFRAVIPKLKFRPNHLFTVGSPVGAVMVMRNLDWESFHPPDDIIHHNLFHPFDPLGYRIEPLIDPVFAGVPAVPISSYSNSQSLFSLPALPSLLPESISSFWENKVPALPRPSIPSLSSLTQMTQSLKAGRWLSSSNGNEDTNEGKSEEGAEENGVSTSTDANEGEEENNAAGDEAPPSQENSAGGHDLSTTENDTSKVQERTEADADASATEYMAAFTASTYLDQPGARSSSTSNREVDSSEIDTTTGPTSSNSERVTPSRRPSLGPRRVSSRIEEVQDSANMPTSKEPQDGHRQSSNNALGKLENVKEETIGSILSPSPMDMEYFLGMESGPTAQEKARGLGAKSDVVQESMVRSTSLSEGEEIKPQKGADEQESTEDSKKNRHKIHVEGRPTKVPYRIDYVLQETTVDQYTNEYLLGMRSHFRYWGNRDIAYHILRVMLDHSSADDDKEVLDLKLSLPPPVTISKGAKEAAEVKAKLAATSARYRSNSSSGTISDQETKKQNRSSFTFPFFGTSDEASQRERQLEQERIRKQEEIDEDLALMDEENELFGYRYSNLDMNSKFGRPNKPKLSQNQISTAGYSESTTEKNSPTTNDKASAQQGWVPAPAPVSVPELTRPAKLHHRSQ